jgi:hypothetical protein
VVLVIIKLEAFVVGLTPRSWVEEPGMKVAERDEGERRGIELLSTSSIETEAPLLNSRRALFFL